MTFDLTETDDQRRERVNKAVEFAGRYVRSFDRELLNHWYQQVVEHSLGPNATHAQLAYHEGQRAFVVGILRQYQLALTGSPDTPWPQQPTQPNSKPKQPKPPRPRKR